MRCTAKQPQIRQLEEQLRILQTLTPNKFFISLTCLRFKEWKEDAAKRQQRKNENSNALFEPALSSSTRSVLVISTSSKGNS